MKTTLVFRGTADLGPVALYDLKTELEATLWTHLDRLAPESVLGLATQQAPSVRDRNGCRPAHAALSASSLMRRREREPTPAADCTEPSLRTVPTRETPTPTDAADQGDEFGTHMPHYQRGRVWAANLVEAASSTLNRDNERANRFAAEADRVLGPLIDVDHAEELRDFIAGADLEFETTLMTYDNI